MAGKRGGHRQGAGRPKGLGNRSTREHKATLGDLARKYTADAMKALVAVATKGASESARVAAANSILDRAYGKPTQAVQHSGAVGSYDLSRLSDEDLGRLEQILGPLAYDPEAPDTGGDPSGEGEESGGA